MLTAKDSTLFESFREDMFTDCEFVAAFNPQAALQLLDQIDELEARNEKLSQHFEHCDSSEIVTLKLKVQELEARLATEREAGFAEAVELLKNKPYEGSYTEVTVFNAAAAYLAHIWKEKPKLGQTVCAHGNQEEEK